MTSVTAPARPGLARRLGFADLAWNTLRQHRLVLIGLATVFAGFGLRLILTGVPLHATYSQYLMHHCVTQRHPACGPLLNAMQASWVTRYGGMVVLPGLIGVFIGAPLASRDFETRTYRFALTQGISGRRQLAVTLLVIGALVIIGGCLLGLLTMWCLAPFHRIALGYDTGMSYWESDYFNITAVLLPAWALLDFCAGVMAGVVIKRTVPAMAAAMAWAVTLAILSTGFAVLQSRTLTQDLVAVAQVPARAVPLLAPEGNFVRLSRGGVPVWDGRPGPITEANAYPDDWPGPRGSLQVSGWFTGPDGQRLSGRAAQVMLNRIPAPVAIHRDRLRAWLAARQIGYWIGTQPADRYWLFQAAAALILSAVAAAGALTAIGLSGRRT